MIDEQGANDTMSNGLPFGKTQRVFVTNRGMPSWVNWLLGVLWKVLGSAAAAVFIITLTNGYKPTSVLERYGITIPHDALQWMNERELVFFVFGVLILIVAMVVVCTTGGVRGFEFTRIGASMWIAGLFMEQGGFSASNTVGFFVAAIAIVSLVSVLLGKVSVFHRDDTNDWATAKNLLSTVLMGILCAPFYVVLAPITWMVLDGGKDPIYSPVTHINRPLGKASVASPKSLVSLPKKQEKSEEK